MDRSARGMDQSARGILDRSRWPLSRGTHPGAPASPPPPPPPPPPVALAMTAADDVSGGPDDLSFTAVFNTSSAAPLADVDAADAVKWNARFDGQRFEGTLLTLLSPTSILVEMVVVGPDSGPNEVNYTNAPSDIADVLGRKLAAFAGFPL